MSIVDHRKKFFAQKNKLIEAQEHTESSHDSKITELKKEIDTFYKTQFSKYTDDFDKVSCYTHH